MKIMVCYDGTNCSKAALNLAKRHAKAFDATVDVVASMRKGTESRREDIESSERGLDWAKSVFESEGIECRSHLLIRGVSAGEDLVQFAEDSEISMVFMGVRRRSKVGKLIMGSTAQYVILNAPCPVVTTR